MGTVWSTEKLGKTQVMGISKGLEVPVAPEAVSYNKPSPVPCKPDKLTPTPSTSRSIHVIGIFPLFCCPSYLTDEKTEAYRVGVGWL